MATGIKKLRTKHELSPADLADKLGVDKTSVSKWERGWEVPDPVLVKEMCILFDAGAETVLGQEIEFEDRRASPYAVYETEELYGTLRLALTTGTYEYPIDTRARESLLSQLNKFDNIRARKDAGPWLVPWTLNNYLLFVNPSSIRRISLVHDDEEAPPGYVHPQVYRELEDWDYGAREVGPMLKDAIEASFELYEGGEEEAIRAASHSHVVHDDGSEEWHDLESGWDTLGLSSVEMSSDDVPPNTFIAVSQYSAETVFVNMDRVALIEVPLQRYHWLSAPEEVSSAESNVIAFDRSGSA